MTMKTSRILLIAAFVVYFGAGIFFQVQTCLNPDSNGDGYPSDIPCAGIPWTPFIIVGWPIVMIGFPYGFFSEAGLAAVLLLVVAALFFFAIRAAESRTRH